jgi:hypothetical protein
MDIVYHRNCLDGAYAGLVLYLISKTVSQEKIEGFVKEMLGWRQKKGCEIALEELDGGKKGEGKKRAEVTEDFFHGEIGVSMNAYSFFAGEFYPLKFPSNNKLLIVVDTNLANAENLALLCKTHELVVLIDHHTSFLDFKDNLDHLQLPNLVYLFNQNHCASHLALAFADHFFSLSSKLSEAFLTSLRSQLKFVEANDLKLN